LPRGLRAIARAAHRAQPSDPPARATEQAQPGVRTLAVPLPRMRRSVGASVSTRRSGRSGPARSGAMAQSARRAVFTTTPRSRLKRSRGPATEPPDPGFNVSSRRVGVSNRQAVASGHVSRDRGNPARGPGRGVGDAASCEHRGVPGPGRAAGSRSRESRSAASGGEQAPSGRAPAGQKRSRHAVTWEKPPAGQNKSRRAVTKIEASARGLSRSPLDFGPASSAQSQVVGAFVAANRRFGSEGGDPWR